MAMVEEQTIAAELDRPEPRLKKSVSDLGKICNKESDSMVQ